MNSEKIDTKVVHSGQKNDETTRAIIPPIYLSTIFAQEEPGKHKGFEYSRVNNPTRSILQENIAKLEFGKFGLVFSSGQAAGACVLNSLRAGDHVLCSKDVYEGTFRLLKVFKKFGIESDFVDIRNANSLKNSIRKNTRLIWLESPTNPLLRVIDIRKVSNIAKKFKVKVLVDNTLATPYIQNPLKLGADIVLHSMTKFLGGHNDVLGGAIVLNDKKLYENIKFLQHTIGAVLSPFDCFLILRGIKTLSVRMERHQKNAMKIAKFLESHKKIERVIFPGLRSHPDRQIVKKQMKGFGGVISFYVKGDLEETATFLKNLELISIADSYGGAETIVQHPVKMIELTLSKEEREKIGLTDNLVRLSVGLEDVNDLINDLSQALEKI